MLACRFVLSAVLLSITPAITHAQPSPAPRNEAACLSGVTMTDARKARLDRMIRINLVRLPLREGEEEEARRRRIRADVACSFAATWREEDRAEEWESALDALPERRQRELWAEIKAEEARRRAQPADAPPDDGKRLPSPVTVAWSTVQKRWQVEDEAARRAKAEQHPANAQVKAPIEEVERTAPCGPHVVDAQGRDHCMTPVWYVARLGGCRRLDAAVGTPGNPLRTPADLVRASRARGMTPRMSELPWPGRGVLIQDFDGASVRLTPDFLSCLTSVGLERQLKGLPKLENMRPEPAPAWVAALGDP